MSCPDESGRTFSKHTPRIAASNSWGEGEIQVLDFVVSTLLRGGNPQMATRHRNFADVVRKVSGMKARIADMKRERAEEKEQESGDSNSSGGGAGTA